MAKSKRFDMWFFVKIGLALLFFLILIYPMFGILRQSVLSPSQKGLTLEHFRKFFDGNYYISTLDAIHSDAEMPYLMNPAQLMDSFILIPSMT